MRIAFLKSYLLWAYATGGERTHMALLRALAEAGHDVIMRYAVPAALPDTVTDDLLSICRRYELPILASTSRRIVYRTNGITVETLRVKTPPASWLLSWLDDLQPDIVMGVLKDTALAPLLPMVWGDRGFLFVQDTATIETLERTLTAQACDRLRNPRFTLIASSEFLRARMNEQLDLSAEVVYPMVDVGTIPRDIDIDAPVTMFGTTQEKGFDTFVHITRTMPSRRFRAVVGWNESEREFSVGNLQYTPFAVDPTDLYGSSSVILVPSEVPEGFGRVALEAMTAGRPVVVSDRGALPEVVGSAGRIVPSAGHTAVHDRWTIQLDALLEPTVLRESAEAGIVRAAEMKQASIRQLQRLFGDTFHL